MSILPGFHLRLFVITGEPGRAARRRPESRSEKSLDTHMSFSCSRPSGCPRWFRDSIHEHDSRLTTRELSGHPRESVLFSGALTWVSSELAGHAEAGEVAKSVESADGNK